MQCSVRLFHLLAIADVADRWTEPSAKSTEPSSKRMKLSPEAQLVGSSVEQPTSSLTPSEPHVASAQIIKANADPSRPAESASGPSHDGTNGAVLLTAAVEGPTVPEHVVQAGVNAPPTLEVVASSDEVRPTPVMGSTIAQHKADRENEGSVVDVGGDVDVGAADAAPG